MNAARILAVLRQLGEWHNGTTDTSMANGYVVQAVKRFQRVVGLAADGVVGPHTEVELVRFEAILKTAPAGFVEARAWRFTRYWLADETGYADGDVPLLDVSGYVFAEVSAKFFANLALEGSGKLRDGRLVNVSGSYLVFGHATAAVGPARYAEVLAYAESQGWIPAKPSYAGVHLDASGKQVAAVATFTLVQGPGAGYGWGTAGGVPLEPMRTAASDAGILSTGDPQFKGKGGTIPRGTKFWLPQFVGAHVSGLDPHDGWWTANDVGGGVEGAQCDLFVGSPALFRAAAWPLATGSGYLWYPGIEDRIPRGYAFGS